MHMTGKPTNPNLHPGSAHQVRIQGWIQDFLRGGSNVEKGDLFAYFHTNFLKFTMKME